MAKRMVSAARRFLEGWVEDVMKTVAEGCNAYEAKEAVVKSCSELETEGYFIPRWIRTQTDEWSSELGHRYRK